MRPAAAPALFIASGICLLLARPCHAQAVRDVEAEPIDIARTGAPPGADRRPPKVAPLFEQPGVLTPRGTSVLEPTFQYAYSSSDRMAIAGFALIPTLFPARVDLREVRRNSTAASLTARHGITNRFEVELRVPYIYRSDSMASRDMSSGIPVDRVFESSGKAVGDAELAVRYQLNEADLHKPYFVAGLRFKSRTGRDPFEVVTDCTTRCTGPGVAGTGLQRDLPTGSGFYALEPNIAWFMPSSPATFFGTFSYMHNFKRSNVSRRILNGESEPLGEITPPDSFGFNIGVGFALNDRAAVSVGYDHISVGRARQNGQTIPGSLRTQLGTAMVGFSYRLDQRRTINVSLGAGLTRDAPDVGMMVRIPFAF
jgi:hypothetical protein